MATTPKEVQRRPPKPPVPSAIVNGEGGQSATVSGAGFNLQYPSDLMSSDEYGKNMVVFFIEVPGQSRTAVAGGDARASVTGVATAVTTADKAGAIASQIIGQPVPAGQSKLGVVGDLITPNNYQRLGAAICLYMPANVSNTYSVDWASEDMTNASIGTEVVDGVIGTGTLSSAANAAATGGIAKTILGTSYGQFLLGKTPGNAKEEQLFKAVNFRTFQFEYKFAPKDRAEADSVLNIIRMFRYHMLPEYADESKFVFVYPSRFQIQYLIDGAPNNNLEKQMTCVLTNMTVSYSDGDQFATFNDGMPTRVNMSLQFKEITLPTKESSPYDAPGV